MTKVPYRRTVGSLIAETAAGRDVEYEIDPRIRWALVDETVVDAFFVWVYALPAKWKHVTARFSGPSRMVLIQAEVGDAVRMVVLPTASGKRAVSASDTSGPTSST
jgi:hypothetical protein